MFWSNIVNSICKSFLRRKFNFAAFNLQQLLNGMERIGTQSSRGPRIKRCRHSPRFCGRLWQLCIAERHEISGRTLHKMVPTGGLHAGLVLVLSRWPLFSSAILVRWEFYDCQASLVVKKRKKEAFSFSFKIWLWRPRASEPFLLLSTSWRN